MHAVEGGVADSFKVCVLERQRRHCAIHARSPRIAPCQILRAATVSSAKDLGDRETPATNN